MGVLIFSSLLFFMEERGGTCMPKVEFFPPKILARQESFLEQRVEIFWNSNCVGVAKFDVTYPSPQFVYQNSFQKTVQKFRGGDKIFGKSVFVLLTKILSDDVQQIPIIQVQGSAAETQFLQTSLADWIQTSKSSNWILWVPWIGGAFVILTILLMVVRTYTRKRRLYSFLQQNFAPLTDLITLGILAQHPIAISVCDALWVQTLDALEDPSWGSVSCDAAFWKSASPHFSPLMLQKVLLFATQQKFSDIVHLLAKVRRKFLGKI